MQRLFSTQSFNILTFVWLCGDDLWREMTWVMIYGDKSHESWARHNSWLWQITWIITIPGSDKSHESWKSFPGSCIAWSHSSAADTFQCKAKPGKAVPPSPHHWWTLPPSQLQNFWQKFATVLSYRISILDGEVCDIKEIRAKTNTGCFGCLIFEG